jgi:hypothetical protein
MEFYTNTYKAMKDIIFVHTWTDNLQHIFINNERYTYGIVYICIHPHIYTYTGIYIDIYTAIYICMSIFIYLNKFLIH